MLLRNIYNNPKEMLLTEYVIYQISARTAREGRLVAKVGGS